MMKIWLIVFFFTWLSLNIPVIQSGGWGLYKDGQVMSFICNNSRSTWRFGTNNVAICNNCRQPKCNIEDRFKGRISATCDYRKDTSTITIKPLKTSDTSRVSCGLKGTVFDMYVGVYSKHFRPENNSPFALDQKEYILVCDRDFNREMAWYDEKSRYIGYFGSGNCQNGGSPSSSYASRVKFSCDKKVMKLSINPIHLDSDDKATIACRSGDKLYFFDIKVNVPVQTVKIRDPNGGVRLEGQRRKFACDSGQSKPAASIWWFITYQNGSEIRILDSIKKEATPKGKTFHTVSTLELDLKREYQHVGCQAKINNTAWKKSSDLQLKVKYPPTGITIHQTSYLEGETTTLTYKTSGGNMDVKSVLWLPGNRREESIQITLDRTDNKKMYKCLVHFEGLENPLSASILLNVEYKPNIKTKELKVIENRTQTISCEAEGNPIPKVQWIIDETIFNSPVLNTSFTRHVRNVSCVATANSSEHGLLQTIQSISVFVSYPPAGITISQTSNLEGETTTLTYKTSGGNMDVKSVLWLPGNHSEESIQITLDRTDNKKIYTCLFYFEGLENPLSASILLNVEYKPNIKTKELKVIENRTQTISCVAEGNPIPKVQWIIDETIFNSPVLNTSFTRHVRNVSCVATANSSEHGLLQTIQSISVFVSYPPAGITISQTSNLEGETTTLTYKTSGGNMDVKSVLWLPGNHSEESIQITLDRTDNKKMYTCLFYFEGLENPLSASILLNVEYKPNIKTKELKVIENRTQTISCEAEGNPIPKVQWIIDETIFNSPVLNTSFTRHVRNVSCVATANSSEHGLLQTIQSISVFVSYPPEITLNSSVSGLHQKAYVACKAQASPSEFVVKMVQKWGNTIKREICNDFVAFPNISLEEFGTWVCRASNNVPSIDYYTESSVELQTPVQPLIKGSTKEMAMFGSSKTLKLCFYSYPEATNVQWFKNGKLISSSKYTFEPAEDGLLPFLGNCSVLQVDTRESKIVNNYSLVITNDLGRSSLPVILLIGQPDSVNSVVYITIISVLAVFIFYLLLGVFAYVKRRTYFQETPKKQLTIQDSIHLDSI